MYLKVSFLIHVVQCFTPWKLGERRELLCPEFCKTQEYDRCCACNAAPCWDLQRQNANVTCGETISELAVEILDLLGTRQLLNVHNTTIYEIIYQNELLTQLPENLCKFSETVVKIDFRNNKLRDINEIKCMRKLDSLHLDNNLIYEIKNDTFQFMKDLRVLTLSGNKEMAKLPPNLLSIGSHNILKIDLKFNNFDEVDITNVFRPGTFCELNFFDGHIEQFTNERNITFRQDILYGPGDIDLENCEIQSFFNFPSYGVSNQEFVRIHRGTIKIDNSSFYCDCKLFPFFKDFEALRSYWYNVNYPSWSFVCNYPEGMRGVELRILYESKRLEQFTCSLETCPSFCTCIDTPSEGRIIVNCSDRGLTEFPDEMPFGYSDNKNIELLIARNNITEIPDRNYLSRLISVDAQGNHIEHISSTAITDLNAVTVINIQDQRLDFLQEDFATKDPNLITFGEHPVECTCDNLWIGDWIRNKNAFDRLWCVTNTHGKIRAEIVTEELLSCNFNVMSVNNIVLPLVSLVAILTVLLILQRCFPYEFLLLYRKCIQRKKGVSSFDVFISVAEDDDNIFSLVQHVISPALVRENYSVKVPWNDLMNHPDRDNEVAEIVSKCRNYVVMLSENYGRDFNTKCEFDALWKQFKSDTTRQIILINAGYDIPGDRYGRRIRAVQRIHKELTYAERDTRMIERLKRRLGDPTGCRPTILNDMHESVSNTIPEDVDEVIELQS